MSDDLTRLVPSAGRLHRDDLIFAAGRASVRVRLWKWLAGGLALSQAVTLGLLVVAWRAGVVSPLIPHSSPAPEGIKGLTPPARPILDDSPPDPSSYIALRFGGGPTPTNVSGEPAGPPLTAGSRTLD